VTEHELHFVVPGPLEQRTGGYLYDAHVVAALRRLGWGVEVHNLEGAFPDGDRTARTSLSGVLASLSDGSRVVIDGLAMGGLPEPVRRHGDRLAIIALVHHPLADETGCTPAEHRRYAVSEREALAPCVGVIVTSEYTARRLHDYQVPPDRIRVARPGTEPVGPARGSGPGEPPRLLCVGTVTPRKGHDVLVAALARVHELEWSCVCAGGLDRAPAFAAAVLRQAAEAGLEGRIDFVGEHDETRLGALYHESSIFVLASHYEGYGMALAEALACGLPVVSTTGGAIPFTVPADAGILVEPGDDRAFADALRELLPPRPGAGTSSEAQCARREAMAAAARRYAAGLPDWQASGRGFARAVLELARGEPTR
jgi:glycosyltransferase involved in cell wall biosynthesis